MITIMFLLLVAFAALEMNLVVLAVTAFLDLIILATINNAVTSDSSEDDITDWE